MKTILALLVVFLFASVLYQNWMEPRIAARYFELGARSAQVAILADDSLLLNQENTVEQAWKVFSEIVKQVKNEEEAAVPTPEPVAAEGKML